MWGFCLFSPLVETQTHSPEEHNKEKGKRKKNKKGKELSTIRKEDVEDKEKKKEYLIRNGICCQQMVIRLLKSTYFFCLFLNIGKGF